MSEIYEASNPILPILLATVFMKMTLIETDRIQHEAGKEITAVLRFAHPEGFQFWKRATYPRGLRFGSFLSKAVSNFNFWEELGSGVHGKTYLVSGGSGSIGVLKLFYGKKERQAEDECKWWHLVYHSLPVVSNVRVVRVMGQDALLIAMTRVPDAQRQDAACGRGHAPGSLSRCGLCPRRRAVAQRGRLHFQWGSDSRGVWHGKSAHAEAG